MQNTLLFSTLLLGSLFAGSTWSHHAAEGIVADEILQMINDNLVSVDSPHLNIDFTDIMGSMSVYDAGEGDLYLTSSAPAYPLEPGETGYTLAKQQAEDDRGGGDPGGQGSKGG